MTRLIIATAILILFSTSIAAQSFQKGNKIFETGLAFTILKYESYNPDFEEKDNSRAANFTVPLSFEYAVGNQIGIGAGVDIVNYFTERDTITNAIASAKSIDVMAKFNFHWLRTPKTDLYSGISAGISSFKFEDNSADEGKFKSTGGMAKLNIIGARFYISEKIALGVNFNTIAYNYKNGKISNKYNDEFDFELSGNGSQLCFAFAFKW